MPKQRARQKNPQGKDATIGYSPILNKISAYQQRSPNPSTAEKQLLDNLSIFFQLLERRKITHTPTIRGIIQKTDNLLSYLQDNSDSKRKKAQTIEAASEAIRRDMSTIDYGYHRSKRQKPLAEDSPPVEISDEERKRQVELLFRKIPTPSLLTPMRDQKTDSLSPEVEKHTHKHRKHHHKSHSDSGSPDSGRRSRHKSGRG